MKRIFQAVVLAASLAMLIPSSGSGCAQPSLLVTYGNQGVERLSYKGIGLEDLSLNPSDAFHIWHMKATDLSGKTLSQGQYGWGEVNNGRRWDAATHTWTYTFRWGSISVNFAQSGESLNMRMTTKNNSDSGIIFDGATIYPFACHFPQLPLGFGDPHATQYSFNVTAPSIVLADYVQGEVAAVAPDVSLPLYSGFVPGAVANTYTPIISTTAPDQLATFLPHNDRALRPGESDTVTVSLRFAPSGTSAGSLAADVYRSWSNAWPARLHWPDRRIIGTVYLANSPQGESSLVPGASSSNPRRYFSGLTTERVDVKTSAGIEAFQARVLKQAQDIVHNLQRLHAQGAITWDIEGEQYPQPTSYACSPDQIAKLAPEMETRINSQESPYKGMRLDDAYFKTLRDAGFTVGVCVRPQHLALRPSGSAQQVSLGTSLVTAELLGKMRYAHDRWGATLFYVDTSVEADGAVLSPDIFKQLNAALPDALIIPEQSTPKHYAYTAPLKSFLFHTDVGTDPTIYRYYPHAFSLNLVNDVDPGRLALYTPQLVEAVRQGDILMVHADYWQANNPTVMQIYQAAAGK